MLPLLQQRSGCTFDLRLCWITKSSLRMKISLAQLQLFQGLYWVHFSTIVLRKLQFQTLTYSSQETSVNYTVLVRWEGFPSFRIYKTVRASIHAMLVISTVSQTLRHSGFYSRLPKVMLHHFNMKVLFEGRKNKKIKIQKRERKKKQARSYRRCQTTLLFVPNLLFVCACEVWAVLVNTCTAQTSVGTVTASPLIRCQTRTRLHIVSTLQAKSDKIRLKSFPFILSLPACSLNPPKGGGRGGYPCKRWRSPLILSFWTCAKLV